MQGILEDVGFGFGFGGKYAVEIDMDMVVAGFWTVGSADHAIVGGIMMAVVMDSFGVGHLVADAGGKLGGGMKCLVAAGGEGRRGRKVEIEGIGGGDIIVGGARI